MPSRDRLEEQEAKHGQKMIEVKVRFWTNDIAEGEGKIVPKNAWTGGVVRMDKNSSHGIDPGKPVPFNSLLDVGAAIEKVLIEHNIVLHTSTKMRKYTRS
jgi:hypothetical protein